MTATTTTTTTTTPGATTARVDAFLAAIAAGRGGALAPCYAPAAVLDATVPNWRFEVSGPDAIAAEYARWFAHPGVFEELAVRPVADGAVVTYVLAWDEDGIPHAAHHCHVLTVDAGGLIAREQVWCGGRWDAAALAEMEAARDAG